MKYAKVAKQPRSDREIEAHDNPQQKRNDVGMLLWNRAMEVADQRQAIENYWTQWTELYEGRTVLSPRGYTGLAPARNDGSKLSVNIVRTKTDTLAAWLQNLLFPSGQKPWKIKYTPVPDLVLKAKKGARGLVSPQMRVPEEHVGVSEQERMEGQQARQDIEVAKRAAEQMEKILHDHLIECDYERELRMMIDQAGQLGTGVVKGPVGRESDYRRATEPKWFFDPETGQPYESTLAEQGGSEKPSLLFVDLWNVFPDMRARDFSECEFVFEQHVLTRNQLLKLAQIPGYDKDAIIRAARYSGTSENHMSNRRQEDRFFHEDDDRDNQYVMWEYHGPVLFEDYCTLSQHLMDKMGDDEDAEYARDGMKEDRQIEREMGMAHTNVTIRLVDGEIISMARSDFDAGSIYHAYTPMPTSCVFGRSMPDVLGQLQRILNALYRDLVNGSRISSTTHIAMLEGVVRKGKSNSWDHVQMWKIPRNVESTSGAPAFQMHTMQTQIEDILQAFNMTRQLIDDVSGIPLISQGDQASHITKTASGMGLLHDNAQISSRRLVRKIDDQVIKRVINSFYRWEMLYGTDMEAKGDYGVEPQGSTVLYSRQVQGELLPVFWQTYKDDPDARAALKTRQIMKQHCAVLGMPAESVLKNDEEIQKDEEARMQQPDPQMEALAEDLAIKKQKVEADFQAKMAKIEAEKQQAVANIEIENKRLRMEERQQAADIGRESREQKTNRAMSDQ